MKTKVYKKHKTQNRFFDLNNRQYLDIHQIVLQAISDKKMFMLIDHDGRDITAEYVFNGKKVAGL